MSLPPNTMGAFNLGNVYPSAFFDYLSRLMPRKLKLLFRWLEYLYVNSGHVFATIKKFSEYPITEFTYDTTNEDEKKKLKDVLENKLKLKACLIQVGIDYHIYGNSFTSLYKPFNRYLHCKKCNEKYNAANYPYEWMPQTYEFKIVCEKASCGHVGIAKVTHENSLDSTRLKIIRWDPKDIDINHNPITGESEYYYNIPDSIKSRLKTKKVDKFLLNTLPWEFIETIKKKRIFKFAPGQIYHMKTPSPAGINQEWGFPGLLGVMKPFFYTAILRKGNEAIALERIVPWRILYPQASSGSNDPAQFINLQRWKNELQDAIKKWRKDPNMVKLSPIPVGMQQMGGDARGLFVANEIQQAEEMIITSLGVPKEFIYGGLTHAGGSVTLRMIENLLFTYIGQLLELAQWVCDGTTEYLSLRKVKIGMVDFKLIDDIQQKQLIGQLYQNKEVSSTTFLKLLDIDAETERDQIAEDTMAKVKVEYETQQKMNKFKNSLATKVDSQLTGQPQYDPNQLMMMAMTQAQQLARAPVEQRNQALKQMKATDPVMATLVAQALGEIHRQQNKQPMSGGAPSPQQSGGGSPSTPMAGN